MFIQNIILLVILMKDNLCLSNPNLSYLLSYPKIIQPSAIADSTYNENIEYSNILTPKPSEYLQPPPLDEFSLQGYDQAYVAQGQNLYQSVIPKKKTILMYPKKYVPEPKKKVIKWKAIDEKPIYMEPENMYIKPSSYQFMIKPNKSELLEDYVKVPSTFMTPPKITQNIEMAELIPITYAPTSFDSNPSGHVYKEPEADYSYDESYAILPKYGTSNKYSQDTYLPNNFKYGSIKSYPIHKYPQIETSTEKYQTPYVPEHFSSESITNYDVYSVTPKYQHKFELSSEKYQAPYVPEQFTTESIKNYKVYPVTPKYHKFETSSVRLQNSYLPNQYTTASVKNYDAYSSTPKYKYEASAENFRNSYLPTDFNTELNKDFGKIYKDEETEYSTFAAIPNYDSYAITPEFTQEDEESKLNEYSTISEGVYNLNPTEAYSNFPRNRFIKKEKPFSHNPFLNKPKEYLQNPFLSTFDQSKFLENKNNLNQYEKKLIRKKKKYATIPNRFQSSETARPLIESSTAEDRQFTITENPKKIFITTENIQSSTEQLPRIGLNNPKKFEKKYDVESEPSIDAVITKELNPEASIHLSNVSPSQYNNPKNDRLQFQMHGHAGPHSYKFGFDTGKGHERQFRYEERDKEGFVKGHYGFYDKGGKLRVVNYDSDPHTGFHAHPEDVE